jgi:hypothetical protein
MAEFIPETQQDFWTPPIRVVADEVTVRPAVSGMAEACPRCASEFLLGSNFCHSCGGRRPEAATGTAKIDAGEMAELWAGAVARVGSVATGFSSAKVWGRVRFPSWLHYLHFHEIKRWMGLPTASLIAFVAGLGCIAGALLVGLLTARNLVDWQAIQFYRGEWLLAATASFVAGILLKKPPRSDRD